MESECLKMSSEQSCLEGVYMCRSWEVDSRSINECIETQCQSCILKSFGSQWKLQTVCCTQSCLWDFRTNLAVNHATVDSKINTTITNKWKRPHFKASSWDSRFKLKENSTAWENHFSSKHSSVQWPWLDWGYLLPYFCGCYNHASEKTTQWCWQRQRVGAGTCDQTLATQVRWTAWKQTMPNYSKIKLISTILPSKQTVLTDHILAIHG